MRFKKIKILILFNLLPFLVKAQSVRLIELDSAVNFFINEQLVLTYQKSKMAVPAGVPASFSKSGFIHPLKTISGEVLTRVQPSDHYHHYGIWGPWTKVKIQDREVDFWNLGDQKGRVEFAEVLGQKADASGAEFSVRQHHFDLTGSFPKQPSLVEDLKIRVEPISKKRYLVDYHSTFTNQLEHFILFEAYRYGGGIAFRARQNWNPTNSVILSSEGKTWDEVDGTSARWIMVSGSTNSPEEKSGILILSYPGNFSHPEPLRVWPSDSNDGRENVFINFTPTRNQSWRIESGKTYTLYYRLIVFDGEISLEEAEDYWSTFSSISIQK
ncbi:MAG: PmoA family protein [Algoriphagus sp.]|uniref:DUF6807 domain-containing protein n=1 Tax=Algoriphagus sp. TaxID=1872435 RepID=UPI00182D1FB7|nr:PmoA family protein [Algoriphagus sp.]NVJ86057.1 PmoA family protein [Algoriphagus sp.]